MLTCVTDVTIELLADRPELVEPVGLMRFDEWGRPPDPDTPQWWINVTRRESGRDGLPVTFVACAANGEAVGAIGIAEFDPDDLSDRSPWVIGMLVRPDRRREGIGRLLVARLDPHARALGYEQIWVATGPTATVFYQRCGYRPAEVVRNPHGEDAHILMKRL
jgi:predicted N-acetyltransferase YhbS